jgi:hypothetical protein
MSKWHDSDQDVADRREAFDAWESYLPRFKASIERYVPRIGEGPTLLDNPLVGLIYADGYLAGKAAARREAGEAEKCRAES